MTPTTTIGRRVWLALLPACLSTTAHAGSPTPAGLWRTFDDRTGTPRGVVRIERHGGLYTGRVISTVNPADAAHTCDNCPGNRSGKPIIGLEIIRGVHRDGDHWDGGTILDPETGAIYHCTMMLYDGGQRLVVRGYIGIALFGRSQSWLRAPP